VSEAGPSLTSAEEEARFIELALLAFDGRLGPDGQAALDAQIVRDADKRRLFVQLCLLSRTLAEVIEINKVMPDPAVVPPCKDA
jgi:hypothetical protein